MNKRLLITTLLFIVCSNSLFAQNLFEFSSTSNNPRAKNAGSILYNEDFITTRDLGFTTLDQFQDANGNFGFSIERFDSSGQRIWIQGYTSPYYLTPVKIVSTVDNGYLFVGQIDEEINYSFINDILVCRLDSMGNLTWSKVFDFQHQDDKPVSITGISNNRFLITGSSSNGSMVMPIMIQIDASGNVENFETSDSGQVNYNCIFNNVTILNDGNYLVTGATEGMTTSHWVGSACFMMKTDTLFNPIWSKYYTDDVSEGWSEKTFAFEYSNGDINYFAAPFSGSYTEIPIYKTNSSGTLISSRSINNPLMSIDLSHVVKTAQGFLILGGISTSAFSGLYDDPGFLCYLGQNLDTVWTSYLGYYFYFNTCNAELAVQNNNFISTGLRTDSFNLIYSKASLANRYNGCYNREGSISVDPRPLSFSAPFPLQLTTSSIHLRPFVFKPVGADLNATGCSACGFSSAITISDSVNVCPGRIVTFSAASTGLTYQWFVDGKPVSGAVHSTFSTSTQGTVFCKMSNGSCTENSNIIDIVSSAPVTYFDLEPDSNTMHNWIITNLSVGAKPFSYQWNWGDGSPVSTGPTPTHTYANSGSYTICLTITDATGCYSSFCSPSRYLNRSGQFSTPVYIRVVDGTQTALQETNQEEKMIGFPNPTDGIFNLHFSSDSKRTILVYSITGQSILQQTETSRDVQLHLDDTIPDGVYQVIAIDADGSRSAGRILKINR